MSNEIIPGLLVVGDEVFTGKLFGDVSRFSASGAVAPLMGEVVFNTSMTGYQEILTDPSYAGQMICFTGAQIGNTGVNLEDLESKKIYASAMIIAHNSIRPSNFRATASLDDFLKKNNTVGLHSVDTRALTLFLRDRGVTPGFIIPETLAKKIPDFKSELNRQNYDSIDWILKVTTKEPYWLRSTSTDSSQKKFKVVAYDYGLKQQLARELNQRGCDLMVVPADYSYEKVLLEKPDGIFLSNGPGDPSLATYAVKNVKSLLGKVPLFGVCMGHQILSLAVGGKTYKLKFGHRGGNQPVKKLENQLVEISSHNHGYAVDSKSLPTVAKVTHSNLNDHCVEGISVPSLKAFSVQYHPESSPGPHDSSYLFDEFIAMMGQ